MAAKGLAALDLNAGDRIAIMADACEEWLIGDLAAQALGAVVYGIYPTASAQEVEYQMRDGGAVIFIAEDQEYIDKILPLADRLPALKLPMIWIEHDMQMVADLADRIHVLNYGRTLASGTPADVLDPDHRVIAAYLGSSTPL